MSYDCSNYCPEGNCVGCKDGENWCKDHRCYPNCSSKCNITETEIKNFMEYKILFITILVLILILGFLILSILIQKNFSFKNK